MQKNITQKINPAELNSFIPIRDAKITCVVKNIAGSRFVNGIEVKHNPNAQELIEGIKLGR